MFSLVLSRLTSGFQTQWLYALSDPWDKPRRQCVGDVRDKDTAEKTVWAAALDGPFGTEVSHTLSALILEPGYNKHSS